MSERRGKDLAGEEYCSQPAKKSSSWILNRWRKPVNATESGTSSNPPKMGEEDCLHNRHSLHQHNRGRWAIPDDETENWSKDVLEFYNRGDAPFCYSAVFNRSVQLDKNFWGTLLGFRFNGYLNDTHIEAWVGRLMNWRSRKLQKDPLLNLRWTILPPKFYECLLESVPKNAATYCNENKEWLMLRLELATQQLVMFPGQDICSGEKYRQVVIPRLTKICVYLGAVLVNLRYWKKTGKPEKIISFEMNDDFVVSNCSLTGNEAVYLCMLMEHLVTDKPINLTGDINQKMKSYRRFMADNLYFWRCLPRPNVV